MKLPTQLFQAVGRQRLGPATCFLCGRRLGTRNRSDEHVFAKWLQHHFDLWEDTLVLLNGTTIPYRQLTIPCCAPCNNDHLSRLERRVQAAIESGFDAVSGLDRVDLMLWLSKILYGVLYKEGLLRRHRRTRLKSPIVTRRMLEHFAMHHYFLQAARVEMAFHGGLPASIYLFRVQCPPDRRLQFDFRDFAAALAVSVRLGEVGILAALQDGGAQLGYANMMAEYQAVKLHPLQFIELSAMFLYKASLFTRDLRFIIDSRNEKINVHQMPVGGTTTKPLFAPWDPLTYATLLATHTGLPIDKLYHGSEGVTTWIRNDAGEVPYFDLPTHPWPPP